MMFSKEKPLLETSNYYLEVTVFTVDVLKAAVQISKIAILELFDLICLYFGRFRSFLSSALIAFGVCEKLVLNALWLSPTPFHLKFGEASCLPSLLVSSVTLADG